MSDKPDNVLNVTSLDLEVTKDPVRVPVGDAGFVTFTDPFDQDVDDTEAFIDEVNTSMRSGKVSTVLAKWLSVEDYAKFRKAYPRYRQQAAIIEAVLGRFEAVVGDQGEGDGSGT